MKNMKKIVMPLAAGVLLTAGAQAQDETRIGIEDSAYVITGNAVTVDPPAPIAYEWYGNDVLIPSCTTQSCTVPGNLCRGYVEFKRKIVVTGNDCDGTPTNLVKVTFKCGGGFGTRIGDLCWADRNVGVSGTFTATAHEYSPFYQWNRNKSWAATGSITDPWLDVADLSEMWTVNPNPCPSTGSGGTWRLPTQADFAALDVVGGGSGTASNNVGSTWVEANAKGNAVAGRFYGQNHASCSLAPNGNMGGCIFLPACGNRNYATGALNDQGANGYYWSSTQYVSTHGRYLGFNSESSTPPASNYGKSYGLSIRCVQ
jgi:uncharacterized protein (TIGR02145 family)